MWCFKFRDGCKFVTQCFVLNVSLMLLLLLQAETESSDKYDMLKSKIDSLVAAEAEARSVHTDVVAYFLFSFDVLQRT